MALGALFYPKGTKREPIDFDSLFIPYIYKEIYFEGVYNDIVSGRKDMIIVDVGSNCGVVTQYLRGFARKVYSIEPSPVHFEALKKNKEFNKWDNVEVFNFAIADKDGKMILNTNKYNQTCNSLNLDYKQGGYEVDTKTLTTFFKEENIFNIDFAKIDIEGYENVLFRTEEFAQACKKIKAMEVEFHFPTFPELVKILQGLGYEARRYNSSAVVILFTKK
jgi:FkbM family methyltransferase